MCKDRGEQQWQHPHNRTRHNWPLLQCSLVKCAAAIILSTIMGVGFPAGAMAQPADVAVEPIVINLATAGQNDTTALAPGRYSFTLINRIPTAEYRVHFNETPIVLEAMPDFVAAGDDKAECATVVAKTEALKAITREKDVPAAVEAYFDARNVESARENCEDAIRDADVLVEQTTEPAGEWTVKHGYLLVMRVVRLGSDDAPAQQWNFAFNPGARGAWRVTYGFTFPVIRGVSGSGVFGDQERFFARQVGEKFVITEGRARRDFDAVPAIFYSFMPSGDAGFRWNPLTAGLGLDLTKPMVLLGTGFTYNDNLLVTTGLGARQEAALLGSYRPGDTITTNLTEAQLTEQVFRLRPFVSVTFRFRSNPFSSGGGNSPPADPNPQGEPPKKEEEAP
jgi:hypothetical protein